MLTALGAVDLSSNLSDPTMAARKKKKILIFDMMGVVFTEGRFSRLIHELVPRTKLQLIRKRYKLFRVGKINDIQFWNGLTDNPIGTEDEFLDHFELDKEFLPLIRKLKQKGYSTAILSNIPRKWKDRLLKKFKFERLFDALIFSCDIGVAKPDKRAYLIAIEILKTDPKNTIFIDDELGNLATADKLGMMTVYVARRKERNKFDPDFRVKRLSQIAKIIGV